MNLVNSDTRQILERHNPDAVLELDNLQNILADSQLDAGLLSLCSDYIEASLRQQDWRQPYSMSELETACIKLCEQFMLSVSGTSKEQIDALRAHLSTDAVYNLMYAIYLIEMSKRLDLTLERVVQ